MWYAPGLWPTACLLVASVTVAAQTVFHNDGNVVYVSAGAIVTVEGSVNNHNDGRLANGGTFFFNGDWSSDTPVSDDVDNLPGTFVLTGDFQDIRGNTTVAFPSVTLTALSVRVQQLATNLSIAGDLYLADAEWSTGSNLATVLNTDPAAIDRGDGYVSSDTIGGGLLRYTDRAAAYLFPVGSNGFTLRTGVPRYRPVIIQPIASAGTIDDVYRVRFANIDPTLDFTDGGAGFDRTAKEASLTKVNPNFYHNVDHPIGSSPADLNFYYDQADGRYSTVAQVQDDGVWRDALGSVAENTAPPVHTETMDRVATLLNHSDFTQPVFTEAGADSDNDGIADRLDLDADNDGIANIDEAPSNPYADHDNDGYFDYIDADFPGCGGLTAAGICASFDFDLDGFANHIDLDSDGDGIADIFEAGGTDDDLDGQIEYPIAGIASSMVDIDLDGFADERDHLVGNRAPSPGLEVINGTPWPQGDRDGDGLPNFQDIDSDADGIVDFIEGQTTTNYYFPNYFDGDDDGIDNAFDFPENGIYAVVPTNTDGVDQPDYLDLNSDNERTGDLAEGNDLDGDGLADVGRLPLGTDSDGDGLDDRYDVLELVVDPARNASNNESFAQQFPNFQNPGTEELDFREAECPLQDCQTLETTRN